MSDQKIESEIQSFVESFKEKLGVNAELVCEFGTEPDTSRPTINVTFNGSELGYMIGNRGKNIGAIQYILSMMINKKFVDEGNERYYINVDVSGYRQQQAGKIEAIALRAADDARILGEPIDMEPMSAADRRVVHMIISKFDDVKSESYGDGDERAVRIIPKSETDLKIGSFKASADSEEAEEESEE
jgi:spoIIIJ-associated protein